LPFLKPFLYLLHYPIILTHYTLTPKSESAYSTSFKISKQNIIFCSVAISKLFHANKFHSPDNNSTD